MGKEILLAILQGITEFLPISSSGHVLLAERFMGTSSATIEIIILLHFGSLLALIFVYRAMILDLLYIFFGKRKDASKKKLFYLLTLTTIVSLVLIYFFHNVIITHLSTQMVGIGLLITGLMIVSSEYFGKRLQKRNDEKTFGVWEAVLVGIFQSLTIIPGLSRSGLTVSALFGLGINRARAIDISFLLSLPMLVCAGLYLVFSNNTSLINDIGSDGFVLVGVSAIATFFAIKWMQRYIAKFWICFAPYCLIVGALVLIMW